MSGGWKLKTRTRGLGAGRSPRHSPIASLKGDWLSPSLVRGTVWPRVERSDARPDGGSAGRAARGWWVLILLIATASAASAQTARLWVLADSVSAGTPFEVAVTVTHGPGRQVRFAEVPAGSPEVADPARGAGPLLVLGDAEALSVRRLPPAVRGAVRVDSAVYRVVTFAADSARVGPVVARVDSAEVQTGTALVPVRSVLRGPPPWEPAPIGPPEAFPSATPLWLALGALALAVIAGAAWGVWTLLRRPHTATRMPPYPAARARLAALDGETPQTPAEVEAHVVAVRDVVRGYLADRLAVPARRETTTELLAALGADPRVPDAAAQAVRQSLVPTDLVVFAGVRPAPEVAAQLRADARAAVEAVEEELRGQESGDRDQESVASVAPPSP